MKQNKFFIIPFIAMMMLGLIFVTTQIPIAQTSPKELPIALVSEDAGPMGENLFAMLKQQVEQMGTETFEFVAYSSVEELKEAMNDQEVYGALVIPSDFSEKFTSLQTPSPTAPTLQIHVNQGMNMNVATVVSTVLTNITTQMNHAMSQQMVQQLESANMAVQPAQVQLLAAPIQIETIYENEVGSLGSAPTAFFQPIWMASILGAVLLYLAGRNRQFSSKKSKINFHLVQSLVGIVYGFATGYFVIWCTTWILDFSFDQFNQVAVFASLACISFVFLILATTSWLKLPSLALYILLMFFGLPLLQLAPEMVPAFYQDYITPWIPMKFLINGMKEILYFGKDLWNGNSTVLLWIAIISFVVFWIKNLVEKPKQI